MANAPAYYQPEIGKVGLSLAEQINANAQAGDTRANNLLGKQVELLQVKEAMKNSALQRAVMWQTLKKEEEQFNQLVKTREGVKLLQPVVDEATKQFGLAHIDMANMTPDLATQAFSAVMRLGEAKTQKEVSQSSNALGWENHYLNERIQKNAEREALRAEAGPGFTIVDELDVAGITRNPTAGMADLQNKVWTTPATPEQLGATIAGTRLMLAASPNKTVQSFVPTQGQWQVDVPYQDLSALQTLNPQNYTQTGLWQVAVRSAANAQIQKYREAKKDVDKYRYDSKGVLYPDAELRATAAKQWFQVAEDATLSRMGLLSSKAVFARQLTPGVVIKGLSVVDRPRYDQLVREVAGTSDPTAQAALFKEYGDITVPSSQRPKGSPAYQQIMRDAEKVPSAPVTQPQQFSGPLVQPESIKSSDAAIVAIQLADSLKLLTQSYAQAVATAAGMDLDSLLSRAVPNRETASQ